MSTKDLMNTEMSLPEESKTIAKVTEALSKVMELVTEQEAKIERLVEIVNEKASRTELEHIAKSVEVLLIDIRSKMINEDHHHHDQPVTKNESLAELIELGHIQLDYTNTLTKDTALMAIVKQGVLFIFNVSDDGGESQSLVPVTGDETFIDIEEVVGKIMTDNNIPDNTSIFLTFNVLSNEPINEQSVLVAPVETQSNEEL